MNYFNNLASVLSYILWNSFIVICSPSESIAPSAHYSFHLRGLTLQSALSAFLVQVLTALCKLDACRIFLFYLWDCTGLNCPIYDLPYSCNGGQALIAWFASTRENLQMATFSSKFYTEVIFWKHKETWAIEKIPVLLRNKNLIRTPIFEVKVVSDDSLTTTEWYLKWSPAGNGSN